MLVAYSVSPLHTTRALVYICIYDIFFFFFSSTTIVCSGRRRLVCRCLYIVVLPLVVIFFFPRWFSVGFFVISNASCCGRWKGIHHFRFASVFLGFGCFSFVYLLSRLVFPLCRLSFRRHLCKKSNWLALLNTASVKNRSVLKWGRCVIELGWFGEDARVGLEDV